MAGDFKSGGQIIDLCPDGVAAGTAQIVGDKILAAKKAKKK